MEDNPYAASQVRREVEALPRWRVLLARALLLTSAAIGLLDAIILLALLFPAIVPWAAFFQQLILFLPFSLFAVLFVVHSKSLLREE